jgi:cytochrome c553
MVGAAVLAGCAQRSGGGGGGGGGGGQAEGPPAAEPGAQPGQAGVMMAQQGSPPGPAQALGQPGAAAAQAGGQASRQAGQELAAKGTPNGATACVTCHGAQGEGNASAGFPRIAGQSAYYLGKQLGAYANGARVNPIMQPIAKAMNAQQIRDVSAYYAELGAQGGAAAAPRSGGGRAQQLAMAGDSSKRVQACANCHGPGGAGEPPQNPYLAGQHAGYLAASMAQWKGGARKTDMSGQMVQIARALSDADVKALAEYFSAQPAPPPASKLVNIAAGSSARPAVAAAAGAPGPKVAGPAASGVTGAGTEQGAPLTGGSQGSGGGGGTQGTQPPQPPIRR